MYEIGDDLLLLSGEKDRLALVENRDLLNMAKAGRASTPVDLMAYEPEDGQPSVFLLRQSPRQSILTVFNWTDEPRSHSLSLADLGVPVSFPSGHSGLPADSAYLLFVGLYSDRQKKLANLRNASSLPVCKSVKTAKRSRSVRLVSNGGSSRDSESGCGILVSCYGKRLTI